MAVPTYVRFFDELGLADVPLVGGKNASLGELYRVLRPRGVPVPNGFAITAQAYRDVLTGARAWDTLHAILDPLDPSNVADLSARGKQARDVVYGADLPDALQREVLAAYHQLHEEYGPDMTAHPRAGGNARAEEAGCVTGAIEVR